MVTTVTYVMTIHVLHAGDGYLYLIRSVAVHDGRLAPGSTLAGYYTASGNPPGRWAGTSAAALGVAGVVTEEQMRALFGDGLHPDAAAIQAVVAGVGGVGGGGDPGDPAGSPVPAVRAGGGDPVARSGGVPAAGGGAGSAADRGGEAGRPAGGCRAECSRSVLVGRALDPVELVSLGEGTARREAVAGYDLTFTPVKSVAVLWALGSEATRQQIFEAHEAAVTRRPRLGRSACGVDPDGEQRAGPDQHPRVDRGPVRSLGLPRR